MIIVGVVASYWIEKTTVEIQRFKSLSDAKRFATSHNERNRCDRLGIKENLFEFHDTDTSKSWSVYGIGISKHNYISETEDEFIRRTNNMALPTYDKNKRRTAFQQLPKGAYVVKILSAKESKTTWGDNQIELAFDIAEGEHAGFYKNQYESNTNEDKKWPFDAVFQLTIPNENSQDYVWTNWNTFFADLEDSNNGFRFSGDITSLKGKLIGGKFHIRQNEKDGKVYDHTRMKWTCVADDVRNGKAGKLPDDKLVNGNTSTSKDSDGTDWMNVPEGSEEELPF